MSVRLRYKMTAAVSSNQAEENDLGNAKFEVVTDLTNEGGVWKTTVAALTTATLNLDDITTAKFLMLRFTPTDPTQTMTAVTVTLNGTAVLPPVYPVPNAKEAMLMLTSSGITAVTVANLDPASVKLDIIVGVSGD
jgi:hypothetical protein